MRALQVLILLTRKDFNPDQPRIPEGEPGAGQWTSEGDHSEDLPADEDPLPTPSIGDDSEKPQDISRRRTGPTGTPAQEARLAIATGQAREAVGRTMELDPTWRGPTSVTDGIEGQIAHQEAMAEAANARYSEIMRGGYGGNNGSPTGREPFASPGTSPAALPYREPDAITAYRNNYTTPDYPLQDGKGTIAITELDGKPIFGMNSSAPGYTPEDRAAADEMRTILREKYPEAIRSDNVSGKPFDLVYHAEATALLRTARTNGGTLQGVTLDMYVDRTMCWSCEDLLPKLGFEIGNPTVWFRDRLGMRRRMRDGAWE